jgi:hypothetical protein
VGVRRISHAVHRVEPFGHCHRFADLAVRPVKLVDVGGNELAFSVVPRAFPYSVTGIHTRLARRRGYAQIRSPGVVAGAFGFRQRLAMRVSATQPTQIAALAAAAARHKERHHRFRAAHLQRLRDRGLSSGSIR